MPVAEVLEVVWVPHPLCLSCVSVLCPCGLGNLSSNLSTELFILAIISLVSRALIGSLVSLFFFFFK